MKEEITEEQFPKAQLASYQAQVLPDYADNPLIECLPPILSVEKAYDELAYFPPYSKEERSLSPEIRDHATGRLKRFFQPIHNHLELERQVSTLIRDGYIGRNPLSKAYVKQLHNGHHRILNKSMDKYPHQDILSTASSFSMIGFSGIGKSTAIERVLSLYPQVIWHPEPINTYQIVWLKLDCPFDGSLKQLCRSFFASVDKLLKTNYHRKFGASRNTTDDLLVGMAHVSTLHCIGVLVIDEMQHLNMAKSGGADSMLNFFVNLVNTIGVAVIMIGTMKALPILQGDFRQARRASAHGEMIWEQMPKDQWWDILMKGMWQYQWTKNEVPLDEHLGDVLYEESQGIIDIAINLYRSSQRVAIRKGLETITPQLLKVVAREGLRVIQPMLQALKSGNLKEISKYDDIRPYDMDEYVERIKLRYELKEKLDQHIVNNKKEDQITISILEQVTITLLQLGIEEKKAEKIAKKVISDNKTGNKIELVQRALEIINDQEKSEKKQSNKGLGLGKLDKNDLRVILNRAKKSKKSAYEELLEEGFIKSPLVEFRL